MIFQILNVEASPAKKEEEKIVNENTCGS